MPPSTIPKLDRRPGPPTTPPTVADDPVEWAAENRDPLRRAVTEHGALLVRGLGLWDRRQVGAVFRRLAGELMTEREAFGTEDRAPVERPRCWFKADPVPLAAGISCEGSPQ